MVNNFKLPNRMYLLPMELPGTRDKKEMMTRNDMIENAKVNHYKTGWVRVGYRIFEAVLVPVTEDVFNEKMREEYREQQKAKVDGRCVISINGVSIRCPLRIPNPLYSKKGQPKTLKKDCAACKYNTLDKPDFNTMSLSHSGIFDEDGEEYVMDPPCGIIDEGTLYEIYCVKVLEFVEKRFRDNVEIMELKLRGYSDTEIAKKLHMHRNTVGNRMKDMKEELLEFLENLFVLYRH